MTERPCTCDGCWQCVGYNGPAEASWAIRPESGEHTASDQGSVGFLGTDIGPLPDTSSFTGEFRYLGPDRREDDRVARALERIADALERAHPDLAKRYAPTLPLNQWDSCSRFHPDEVCKPGQNHPAVNTNGS